jgi:hypothetical protein
MNPALAADLLGIKLSHILFSPWRLVLARLKTHRLKPAPLDSASD